MILKIIYESILQALHQLSANKLRTFLSLLGISIGIFCIIAVKSAVDSLENNIMQSMDKFGKDVLYVTKMPWGENPRQNYWKYFQRPPADIKDFEAIEEFSEFAQMSSFSVILGEKNISFVSSNVEDTFVLAVTERYAEILSIPIEYGRWFTPLEYQKGINNILIGANIKDLLFGPNGAVGKVIKLSGIKYQIIGIIEKSGNNIINPTNFDDAVLISYNCARKKSSVKSSFNLGGYSLAIKAKKGVDFQDLKDEVTGLLRSRRRLSPKEKNNFALNEISILSELLGSFFGVVNLAGFVIGLFALLVGMFSVVNIMFVSVKERTSLIGIKKALGAKQHMILLEFLVEAIILCVIGGIIGLGLVMALMLILDYTLDYGFVLSWTNIVNGVGLSAVIGVLAGVIPALGAARMDPVEAIRK